MVVSPGGLEVRRVSTRPDQEVPFDLPASAAFVGERALVTNRAVNTRNPPSLAILGILVGARGMPLFRPTAPRRRSAGG